MSLDPVQSFEIVDASVDSTFTKRQVIVGQSNDATAGIYKGIENYTLDEINTLFGAKSHIAALLRDAVTNVKSSYFKPSIWAISYIDNAAAVARILTCQFAGTSTKDTTLRIRVNNNNPDRLSASAVSVLALRNTKDSKIGDFAVNANIVGAPSNATQPFNPVLSKAADNDTVLEITVPSGTTADELAALVNTAIAASTTSIYSSTVSTDTVTLTSRHKGALSNFFNFEIDNTTLTNTGISFTLAQDTAGSDVVDATGILDLTDDEGETLSNLDYDFITLPYDYSIAALVTDSYAKRLNVQEYNNRTLEYYIFRGTAIDLSDGTDIGTVATANPVEAKGIVKSIFIIDKPGVNVKPPLDYAKRKRVKDAQCIPIQKEVTGEITVGQAFTLSDSDLFKDLEKTLTSALYRQIFVEKFIPDTEIGFREKNYIGVGNPIKSYDMNRDMILATYKYFRDILDGTVIDSKFSTDFSGIIVNTPSARSEFDEILDATLSFNSTSKTLEMDLASILPDKIVAINTRALFN